MNSQEEGQVDWPLDSANGKLSYSKMIFERNMCHFTRPKSLDN